MLKVSLAEMLLSCGGQFGACFAEAWQLPSEVIFQQFYRLQSLGEGLYLSVKSACV